MISKNSWLIVQSISFYKYELLELNLHASITDYWGVTMWYEVQPHNIMILTSAQGSF